MPVEDLSVFVVGRHEPRGGSLRQPGSKLVGGVQVMKANERPRLIQSKTAVHGSEQCLAMQYAELLRLRKAVRLAELLAGRVSQNPTASKAN